MKHGKSVFSNLRFSRSTTSRIHTVGLIALAMAAHGIAMAQEAPIPLSNQPPNQKLEGRFEVETVEIRHGGAIPNEIHRSAGPFILVVSNQTGDLTAEFVVERVKDDGGQDTSDTDGPIHIVSPPARRRHRTAAILRLHPGTFAIKAAATGQELCQITIE